ncbi:MAG TPA: TonB-dependent receptor [Bacteroidota bacterium]|nr:TonB-dependent receptor [Bacteroidota bacterium]
MFLKLRSTIAVGLLVLFCQPLQAQETGAIKGRVIDKATGDPLPYANVLVVGTNIGAATDIGGNFILHNIAVGTRTLRVGYVGYGTVTRDINVTPDNVASVEFSLSPQAVEGETIVVTGQAKGQMEAINQQLASNSIINVVSSDKMKELPDANIAESIGRLPGISLQRNAGEAYAVVVRGLSPKYNEVTIEGVPMSSTNYYDRSVDLSLLNDDLVRGVEVSKTLRPDMDADALGGTVNLTLKTADPGLHYSLSGLGAYTDLRQTYKNYRFSGTVSDRFLDDQVGILVQGNIEQKQLPSDQFSGAYDSPIYNSTTGSWFVNTNNALLTESNLNRHRYAASVVLDYTSDLVDVKFYNVYDQKRDSSINRTDQSNFESNGFQYNIYVNDTKTEQRTHSLQALFKLGGTELPVSLSYTRGSASTPRGMEFWFYQTNVSNIPSSQIIYGDPYDLMHVQGVMDPNSVNSTLWNMFNTNSLLTDESFDAKIDWKVPFKLSDYFTGKLQVGGKTHGVRRTSAQDKVWYDVQWGGSKGRRTLLIAQFPYLTGVNADLEGGVPAGPFVDPSYSRKDILGYPIGPGYNVYQLISMMNTIYPAWSDKFYVWGPDTYNQDYLDNEHTAAGYVMGEFNLGSDLTVVPGVRYQDEVTDISAYHIQLNGSNQNGLAGVAPVWYESRRNTPNWFPSVNVKYRATDNIQVIGAAYRSLSLPSYGEISPMVEYAVSASSVTTANPMLRPSTAWNFDLGASYSSNDVGLLTVNLFYKEISDLIYSMQHYMPYMPYPVDNAPSDIWDRIPSPTSGYFDLNWANVNAATGVVTSIPMNDPAKAFLRGIEISWQTHFWYLPSVLSGLVLDLNASYMSSRQFYPSFNLVQVGGSKLKPIYHLIYQTVSGPLQNQPRAIYNAILGWDYAGFSSRFSLRYQQETLTSMDTQYGLENYFYDNVLLIDISLKQQLIGNLAVFANATNVNAEVDNYYFSHPAYGVATAGQLPTNKQTYGWAVQFGVTFNY